MALLVSLYFPTDLMQKLAAVQSPSPEDNTKIVKLASFVIVSE